MSKSAPAPSVRTHSSKSRRLATWRSGFRLLTFLQKYRRKLIAAAIAIQVGNLLQLLFAVVAGSLVDGTLGLTNQGGNVWTPWLKSILQVENINVVGATLGVLMLVVVFCRYFELTWFYELGERAIADLRVAVFSRLMYLPMGFFTRRRVGDLGSRLLSDLAHVQEHWINDLRQLQTHGTIVIASLALMALTSLKLMAALAVVAPVMILAAVLLGRFIRRRASESQTRLGESAVILEESLHGIQNVKVCATEEWEVSRYQRSLNHALLPAIRGARHRALFICIIVLALLGAWVFMMWHGSRLIEQRPDHPRELSPGAFFNFMFLVGFVLSSGGTLAELFSRLPRAIASAARVHELLEEEPEHPDAPSSPPPPATKIRGGVVFDEIEFFYPGRPAAGVLRGISLEIEPGENVALVGPSGAGKSTLASLVCRLFDPTSGRILIDGRPATDYPLHWLRSQMAFVTQEVMLFGGTIAENIAYGKPDVPLDEIRIAAEKARALDFIDAMPDKFQTRVGDRGSRLSGGQRQRIALARALLRDPAILILDEATSALDSENERLVQEALDELMAERTTFIIAHRLSTVRKADRILVLEEGRVVESGTHAELYNLGGAYRRLCDHQYFDLEPNAASGGTEAAG
ncbi:MAG: ABC transporter ATP-binding protein [Verrucomicrobiales bacterium]